MTTRTALLTFAVLSALLAPARADAADVRVHYLLEERALRAADASSPVHIALFTDAACTTATFEATLALGDVDLLARVAATRLRGAPKTPKSAELSHTLRSVPAAAPLYARVSGPGVVSVGSACQIQNVAVPPRGMPVLVDAAGTVLGPYGLSADRGFPVWIRPSGDLTYAVVVETTTMHGDAPDLYYEAADCSSAPLIYADYYSQLLFFQSVSRGTTLYYPVSSPSQHVARAHTYEAATPADCSSGAFVPPHHCCHAFSPGQSFPADFLATDTTDIGQYVAPFHVELR
ncbi:MAG: hypothetical protein ABIR79_11635 [Candidatus Binatia bacterium]